MSVAIVELLDKDGAARQMIRVAQWPATIGRAIDCDVVVDDPHVAPHHATILETDGALSLLVGDTVNGASWPGRRLRAGETAALPTDRVVQVGATRLRIRSATDALAPERPFVTDVRVSRAAVLALALALLAGAAAEQWLQVDPGSSLPVYLTPLIGIGVFLLFWCGFWSAASKLFKGRFEFWRHSIVALRYLVAVQIAGIVLPLLAFSGGWPSLTRVLGFVIGALLCAMLARHLTLMLPHAYRMLPWGLMSLLFAGGTALSIMTTHESSDQYFGQKYLTTIGPPAMRLAAPVAPAVFLNEARALQAAVDAHRGDDDAGSQQ